MRRNWIFVPVTLFLASSAGAQVLEEVTVTAQKREQRLQDVGISVTAFSGDQLRELGLTNTDQIDDQVPGLLVTSYGSGTTTVFTIRGSGQLDFSDQQEPPVAVYLDGAYNPYLSGVGFNFFDLERIEVLRGSQGTLFGRNATGGLTHLISKKPTRELEGFGEFTLGEYDKIRFEGAVGGPLTDSLAGRIAILYEEDDGYVENLGIGENGSIVDNFSGRAQLLFEPNEDLEVLVAGRWSIDDVPQGQLYHARAGLIDVGGIPGLAGTGEVRTDITQAQFAAYCAQAPAIFGLLNPLPTPPNSANCWGYQEDGDEFTSAPNTQGKYERDHYGVTGTIKYDLGWGEITSITDYQDFKKRYLEDVDSSPFQLFDFFQNMDSTQFSEEFRLAGETDRTRWVVGAYYLNIDADYQAGVDGTGAFGLYIDNLYALETTTYAGFGQFEYDFTPTLTGIAGIRWTEDEKDYVFSPLVGFLFGGADRSAANAALVFSPLVAGDGFGPVTREEGDWSGHIELDWKPNDDWLVYGKVSRGHKAGGFNGGGTAFFLPNEAEYKSELPVTYEGGFKASLFEGTTRLNASVFYTDYKDFQTFTVQGLSLFLFNVDAEVVGSEIELVTNPWEGWEFLFGVSLLDAQQLDVPGFDGIRDRPMPNAPDVTLNGLARYEWPAFNGTMAVQFDFSYVDERSLNAIDNQATVEPDYIVTNAKIGWTTLDGKWHVEFWGKNLNDEVYFPTDFQTVDIFGSTINVPAAPRWFGGTVRYSF